MHGPPPGPYGTRTLLAYDGTASARRALLRAARMHRDGDDLAVICVSPDGSDREGHLGEAVRLLAERGIAAEPIAVAGETAQAICVTAARDGYDTIVIGRRNALDAHLLLLGRVASRVVDGAACDVVVVA
jgi:nucleotide-binding universal stress UspA family protein